MEKQLAIQAKSLQQHQDIAPCIIASACYQDLFEDIPFEAFDFSRSRNNPALLWQLRRLIRQQNADILHAHGHKAAAILKRLRVQSAHMRIVATAHGTKHNNRVLAGFDKVFAVSKGVQEAIAPIKSQILYNAVPPYIGKTISRENVFSQFNLDPDKPLLMAIGRLAPVKRFDRLMRAVAQIPANLLIFGEGPEQKTLSALQTPTVRLAGYHEDVQSFLPAADFVVIASEREGLSLTLIEALLADVKILSTPVSGSKELLPECCLVSAESDSRLAADLNAKIRQSHEIEIALAPAHARAHRRFSPHMLARQLLTHYHDTLERA